MQIMPIMFTAFFAFFPSGLVLYWVTNTVLSIGQQWYINKVVHEEAVAKKGGKKKKDKPKSE
jgi:YidC/Oxa1 family membrane protein insertase